MHDRHTTLIAAGWTYDAAQDRYQAPGADPVRGTWHNQEAAWLHEQQRRAPKAEADPRQTSTDDPRRAHEADPRRSKPQ